MKLKHIIWDWNGTLLDDRWLSVAAINRVLSRYDLPEINEDRYLEIFGFPVIDYYSRLGFDFNRDPFEKVGTEFIDEYEARMYEASLFTYVSKTLKEIREAGITQSVLSAGKQKMLDDLMRYHEIDQFFEKVVGQDNHYAFGKSEAGSRWIRELDMDPKNVIMIGDTVHDADVARKMDVSCILLEGGHASRAALENTGKTVLKDIKAVLPRLKTAGLL